jgi:hypothetical protein
VILGQGSGSTISPGKLASSGSGSADWSDLRGCRTLNDLVKGVALRELKEECGLESADVERFRTVGFGRLLGRGGKPEFFCIAKLSCDFSMLQITRPERHLTDFHTSHEIASASRPLGEAIAQFIDTFLVEHSRQISTSLWWNLWLLRKVPTDNLEQFFGAKGNREG